MKYEKWLEWTVITFIILYYILINYLKDDILPITRMLMKNVPIIAFLTLAFFIKFRNEYRK